MAQRRTLKVAIIGAGMSGLCMAIKLQDAGINSFTIFEKADEVGGTWRDNTYPGLSCDVPSSYYAYSFRPNPDWSRLLPPGPEVQAYFRQVADERGIRPHIRFGTDITSAGYRDGQWWVTTGAGEEAFDVLITATGFLRVPRYPEIPGLETFAGPVFHSSRWDHSVSLPDKRIGLIGTGSTGVQITAELGGKVRALKIFQRTAQWVYPWPNLRYPAAGPRGVAALAQVERTRLPVLGLVREEHVRRRAGPAGLAANLLPDAVPMEPAAVGPRPRATEKADSEGSADVQATGLRGSFLPLRPATRRGGGHRIHRPHRAAGIVTADGTLHEIDLLVLATGFDARAYVRPMQIIGEDGLTPRRGLGRRPDGVPLGRGAGVSQPVHADGPAFADR